MPRRKTRKLTQDELRDIHVLASMLELRDTTQEFCQRFMDLSTRDLSIKCVTKDEIKIVKDAIKVLNDIEGRIDEL